MGHYPHPWGNELRFGRLEPLYGAAFSAVMLLCILGGKKQLAHDLQPSKQNLYYVLCDLVLTALLARAFANDVVTGYVFIGICTLASCGLLMIRQLGRTTLASVRYMIFSLLGSGLFLLGIVMLYEMTGHLLMPNLRETIAQLWQSGRYHTALTASICLITIGLAVKSGLFPFHFWMPDTYGCATPCSSGILSGLVSKGYIFLLLKLIFNLLNPLLGLLLGFFSENRVGRTLTKSFLTTALLTAVVVITDRLGYGQALYQLTLSVDVFVPVVLLLIFVWYLVWRVLC